MGSDSQSYYMLLKELRIKELLRPTPAQPLEMGRACFGSCFEQKIRKIACEGSTKHNHVTMDREVVRVVPAVFCDKLRVRR